MMDDVILPGTKIKTTNLQEVTLEEELGSGYTAVVYKGIIKDGLNDEKHVAVKIAKDFPEAERLVKEEYEILNTLASELVINNRGVTPNVYGKGEINGRSFIVMEFVSGRPIIEESHWSRWNEPDAIKTFLSIFWFFEELQLKKRFVFPDLKPENFFWSFDDGEGRLRVIDLGGIYKTTSTDQDPNWPVEVFTISTYLFGVLKGRRFNTKLNQEPAENIIKALENENLSYGTKNLLKRLLTREKQNRLIDVKNARIELQTINRFWTSDREDLLTIIRSNMAKADSEKEHRLKYEATQRAAGALDVLKLRFAEDAIAFSDLSEKINALEKANSYVELAKAYIQINDFGSARKALSEGEVLATDPTSLHLWGYVIDTLEKTNVGQREKVYLLCERIIKEVEGGSTPAALEIYQDLANQNEAWGNEKKIPSYLNYLTALQEGQVLEDKNELEEALSRYKQAREFLKELPNRERIEFLHFPEFGTIDLKIADLIKSKQAPLSPETHSWSMTKSAVQNGNISVAYKGLLYSAVHGLIKPSDFSEFYDILRNLLEEHQLQMAKTLSGVVDYIENPSQELKDIVDIIRNLSATEKAVNSTDSNKVAILLRKFHQLDSRINQAPFIQSYQKEFLSSLDKNSLDSLSDKEIGHLKNYSLKFGDTETHTLLNAICEERNRFQEERTLHLITEIWCELLDPQDWNLEIDSFLDQLQNHTFVDLQGNLEKSAFRLANIQIKLSQIAGLTTKSQRILDELEKLKSEYQRQYQNNEALISSLKELTQTLQESNQKTITEWRSFYRGLQMKGETANLDNDQLSEKELRSQVNKVLVSMIETSRLTGDLTSFCEISPQVFLVYDLLGHEEWGSILRKMDLSKSVDHNVSVEIDQSIENGELEAAMLKIQKLDAFRQLDPEIIDRRIHILQLLSYNKQLSKFKPYISQCVLHRPLLELLSQKRHYRIPHRLYDTQGISAYLAELYRLCRMSFDRDLTRLRSTEKFDSREIEQIKESITDFLVVKKAIQSVSVG